MRALRAVLLNLTLYLSLAIYLTVGLPVLAMPRAAVMAFARYWGHYFLWLCRVVGGMKVEFRGLEKIPAGPLLIAAKHQSLWETFALLTVLRDPCFILKRELTYIPLFGWYAIRARQLPVDRKGGGSVLKNLGVRAREEVRRDNGRQLLFFPEGTRRPAGAEPAYRHGVSHIYEQLDVPCLPVALNAGLYWPRRSLQHRQGTILVTFLDPIPPGMTRTLFLSALQDKIETESDALLAEGIAALNRAGEAASNTYSKAD
jgi:1-acyl-sn-glycerol-3-phosphate acyltransferase